MNLIVALFFRSPFWVQFIAAAGLVWLGWTVQQQDAARAIARAELLQQAPPATISITAFSNDAPGNIPVELSVTAQVALDHNTRLIRKTNLVKTGEDLFYVLVDPAVGTDTNVAVAGIVIDPDQLDAFTEWMMANTTDFGAAGPIVTINGLRASESSASHAYDAMKEQGMVKSPDFFFIEPFIAGRDATLAALPAGQMQLYWVFYGLAGILALIGVKKLQAGSKPKPAAAKPTTAMPLMADKVPAGRGAGAYSLDEMQAGHMLAPANVAKPAKPPMAKSRLILLLVGAVLIGGLVTNQSWAYAILPLGFFGLVFLGLRNGIRSATLQLGAVIDKVATKPAPTPAPTPFMAAASLAAKVPPAAMKGAAKDNGPIRPGFSFKDLMPTSRPKAGAGPDPFERLTQQRLRQENGSSGR